MIPVNRKSPMGHQSDSLFYINGNSCDSLSPLDRGLAYGDGLFETIAWRNDILQLYSYHLERLTLGCKRLLIPLELDILSSEVGRFVSLLRKCGYINGIIKIIVSRGQSGRGYAPPDAPQSTRVISYGPLHQYPLDYTQRGIALQSSGIHLARSSLLAGLKHLNRLEQVMAKIECLQMGAEEVLLSDERGDVIEAVSSNVFVVVKGELHTPRLNFSGVAGVMRRHVIEDVAPALNVEVREMNLSFDDILAADEVFLTNSLIGLWPVIQLQNKSWAIGPISRMIQTELRKSV